MNNEGQSSPSCSFRDLLQKNLFAEELRSSVLTCGDLDEWTRDGRAAVKRLPLGGGHCFSWVVKERHQGAVSALPIGARSLLLEKDPSVCTDGKTPVNILCRGVNKFFDLRGDAEWAGALPVSSRVVLMRKLAGYVVHLFSIDGVEVMCMSKHSTEGHHAATARTMILTHIPSADAREKLARVLCEGGLVLSAECTTLKHDNTHPVSEGLLDSRLNVFSAQVKSAKAERSLRWKEVVSLCAHHNLPVVPYEEVPLDGLRSQILSIRRACLDWSHCPLGERYGPGEGYVILVELSGDVVSESMNSTELLPFSTSDSSFCTPLRLKLKTSRYQLVRCIRSRALGEFQSLSAGHEFNDSTVYWLFFAWAVQRFGSFEAIQLAVRATGVASLFVEFEALVDGCCRKRLRDGRGIGTVGEIATREAHGRESMSHHTLLMFVGLPGAGKSSLTRLLVEELSHRERFRSVIWLSRDEAASDVATKMNLSDSSSAHQHRLCKKRTHVEYLSLVLKTRSLLSRCASNCPSLVILDACNIEPSTQKMWRELFPLSMRRIVVNLHVPCVRSLIERTLLRGDHPTLRGVDAVQSAIVKLSKKIVAADASGWSAACTLDTFVHSPSECVTILLEVLLSTHVEDSESTEETTSREVTVKVFRNSEVREAVDECVQNAASLCGLSAGLSGARSNVEVGLASKSSFAATVSVVEDEVGWHAAARVAIDVVAGVLQGGVDEERLCKQLLRAGNARWIAGQILRTNQHVIESWSRHELTDKLVDAFRERFERCLCNLHVTLVFTSSPSPSDATASARDWIRTTFGSGARNQTCSVYVCGLLLDASCLCLDVRAVSVGNHTVTMGSTTSTSTTSNNECGATALHITLGHLSAVKASYAGSMRSYFEQWESENLAIDAIKMSNRGEKKTSGGATRKLKRHNFLWLRLPEEVVLRGSLSVDLAT